MSLCWGSEGCRGARLGGQRPQRMHRRGPEPQPWAGGDLTHLELLEKERCLGQRDGRAWEAGDWLLAQLPCGG